MICSEMEYEGPIAVHAGHCKTEGRDFSLLPSFLLPRQQVSRQGLTEFVESWKKDHCVRDARESFADGVAAADEDRGTLSEKESRYSVPCSTAYQWLYALIVRLRLHAGRLQIEPPEHLSVYALIQFPLHTLTACFEISLSWRVGSSLFLIPP
jgi:hypothetical protein